MYGQMAGMFLLQGTGLDTRLFWNIVIPVTSNHVFNILAILILVPIFDRIIYPALRRWNVSFTPLNRIAAGMLFGVLGLFYAGGS